MAGLLFYLDRIYRISKILLPFLPPAPLPARRAYRPEGKAYASERRKAITYIPLRESLFGYKNTIKTRLNVR
jgi:hypothetical protein